MLRSASVCRGPHSPLQPKEDRLAALKTRRHATSTAGLRVPPRIVLRERSFSVHATSSLETDRQNGTARSRSTVARQEAWRVIFKPLAKALVNGHFKSPVDLFTALDELQMISTVNQCNDLMMQFLGLEAPSAMIELLKFMKWKKMKLNENTYSMIISACRIEADLEKACLYFDQLQNSPDIPVTVGSYQSIITASIECEDYEKAHNYFDEMLDADIRFDGVSLERVFRRLGYKKQNPLDAAALCMKILKEMESRGIGLTREIGHSAAWAFSHAEDTESLLALQKMMQKSGVKSGLKVYNGLFFALAKSADNAEIGARLFEDMKANGIRPVPQTYHLLLRVFTTARDEVRSMALVEEMEEAGVLPTLITYNSAINSFIRKFSESEKEEVWKRLEDLLSRMTTKGIDADVLTYVELLNVCVKNSDRDHAEQFFEDMQIKKIPRDNRIFVRLIKVYAEGGDLDDASADAERISALLEQMELEGLQLDCAGCTQIMWSFARSKSMEKAQPVLKHIRQHGVHYDKLLLEYLLTFSVAVDETDMTADFVDAAAKQSDLPERAIHHILLQVMTRFKKTAATIEHLEKMRASGRRFSMITYRAIEALRDCDVSEEERSRINDILGPYSPLQKS